MIETIQYDEKVGYYPIDWDLKKVKNLGDFFGGSTPSTIDPTNWGGEIVWLVPTDLTALNSSTTFIYDSENKITQMGFRSCSTSMLPIGTLCLSSRATIGEAVIAGVPLCTNQGFINLVPNESCNALYMLYWVKQNKNYISRYAAGTTFLEIGRRAFKNLKIALPKNYNEQRSIAEIISKVDESIEVVEKSIIAAERLKKSMLQNLLNGKLKPDGTWRSEAEFYSDEKFGKVPLGWEIKKVKEVIKLKNGKGNTTSNLKEIPDSYYKIPVFGGNGITGYYHTPLLTKETLIIGRVGEYCGNVFKTPKESWVTDNAMLVDQFLIDNVDLDFLELKLNSLNFKRFSDSTGQPKITQGGIGALYFTLPMDINEQYRISKILNVVSETICMKQSKIKSLNTLKKSLMQNLLSGKVRVNVEKINKYLEVE